MSSTVDVIDNTAEALREIERAKARGLEKCGLVAERYAKKNIKANKSIVTSNLINSITHKRVGDEEYVGTNVERRFDTTIAQLQEMYPTGRDVYVGQYDNVLPLLNEKQIERADKGSVNVILKDVCRTS